MGKTQIKKNGTIIAARRNINFIQGANVTLTVTDTGVDQVNVTIASSGGGGGGSSNGYFPQGW